MYVETPAAFNQALAGLRTSSPAPSTTPGVEPRIALSAGVDVDKLLAWLGELAAGLKAAPLTCPWLAELNTVADELSQLSGGLPPMLRGLRGLSIVVDDFQLAPPSGTAHLIVVGDQVQAIVGLLQQLPLFAGLPAPTLGIPVAVPVQQLGLAGVTSAHLSVSNERFGLAVGDDSAARLVRAMATPDQQRSPLFSIGYDMEWFREQFPSDDPDRFSDADHVTIVLDVGKRGLVMGVKVRWVPTLAR